MTQLQGSGDGGGFEHCSCCGALAAGPCARCGRPTCGDCCVLTEGGASVWAVCIRCDRREGHSLQRKWLIVLGWFAKPILLVTLVLAGLWLLFGDR